MKLIDKISAYLLLPRDFIEKMARSASHQYKEYKIRKRQGGFRKIYHPSKQLKTIQRFLLDFIIEKLPVSDSVFSYRKDINIAKHAKVHVKSNYLLRMDFENFFPSITSQDIQCYIENNTSHSDQWDEGGINLFCNLVCKDNCLTIGAPTSPGLSNAICYELDVKLKRLADDSEVSYTRYADDLFFSTMIPNLLKDIEEEVKNTVRNLQCPSDLKINERKTRHSSKKGRRQVTGIVLGSDEEIYLGRDRKRKIRSMIHKIEELDKKDRRYLAGMLAFAKDIEPDFINDLVIKYDSDKIDIAQHPPNR